MTPLEAAPLTGLTREIEPTIPTDFSDLFAQISANPAEHLDKTTRTTLIYLITTPQPIEQFWQTGQPFATEEGLTVNAETIIGLAQKVFRNVYTSENEEEMVVRSGALASFFSFLGLGELDAQGRFTLNTQRFVQLKMANQYALSNDERYRPFFENFSQVVADLNQDIMQTGPKLGHQKSKLAPALALWDEELTLPPSVQQSLSSQITTGRFFVGEEKMGEKAIRFAARNLGAETRIVYQLLGALLDNYGTDKAIPENIRQATEHITGAVFSDDGKIDPTAVKEAVATSYQQQIGRAFKVEAIPIDQLPKLSDQLITPEEIAQYQRLKQRAQEALQKERARSTQSASFPNRVRRIFTREDLGIMFRGLEEGGYWDVIDFRVAENGKATDQKTTLNALLESWGHLTPRQRIVLLEKFRDYRNNLDHGMRAYFYGRLPLGDSRYQYVNHTTMFDFVDFYDDPNKLARFADDPEVLRKFKEEGIRTALPRFEALAEVDASFNDLITVIRERERQGDNLYVALWQAKKGLGPNLWEKCRAVVRSLSFLSYLEKLHLVQSPVPVSEAQTPPGLRTQYLLNPPLAAKFKERWWADSASLQGPPPTPYGDENYPVVFPVEEGTCYMFVGGNAQGKSRLSQTLTAALIGFPVYVGEGRYDERRQRWFIENFGEKDKVKMVNMPEDLELQPLFAVVPHEGLSLFQGIAMDTWSIIKAGKGAYDEPGKGTSPSHQQAITTGLIALEPPFSVVTHGGQEVYNLLRLLDPDAAQKIRVVMVEEYKPRPDFLAESSGGLQLMEVIGLPPELLTNLQQAAAAENLDFTVSPESRAMAEFTGALPSEKTAFITPAELHKLGFHAQNAGILTLMTDLLQERLYETPNLPCLEGASDAVTQLKQLLPDLLAAGLTDERGMARRQALVEIFLKKGAVRQLLTNQYIRGIMQALPEQFHRPFQRFLESDLNVHLSHFAIFSSLSQIALAHESAAEHLLTDLAEAQVDPNKIKEYVSPLTQAKLYSPATRQFLEKSSTIVSRLTKLLDVSVDHEGMQTVLAETKEDVRRRALEILKSLPGKIQFTEEEKKTLDLLRQLEETQRRLSERQPELEKGYAEGKEGVVSSFWEGLDISKEKVEQVFRTLQTEMNLMGTRRSFTNILLSGVDEDHYWTRTFYPSDFMTFYDLVVEIAGDKLDVVNGRGIRGLVATVDNRYYGYKRDTDRYREHIDKIKEYFTPEQAATLAGRLAAFIIFKTKNPPTGIGQLSQPLEGFMQSLTQITNTKEAMEENYKRLREAKETIDGIKREKRSLFEKKSVADNIGALDDQASFETMRQRYQTLERFLDEKESARYKREIGTLIDFGLASNFWHALRTAVNRDFSEGERTYRPSPLEPRATVRDLVKGVTSIFGVSERYATERLLARAGKKISDSVLKSFTPEQLQQANLEMLETFGLIAYANLLNKVGRSCKMSYNGGALQFENAVSLKVLAEQARAGGNEERKIGDRVNQAIRGFTPFSFNSKGQKVWVMSGLNGAGKSSFRNAMGEMAILGRYTGFLASDNARFPEYEAAMVVESEGTGLDASAFTQSTLEVRNMAWNVRNLKGKKTLVLADEILAGTSEEEGRAGIVGTIKYLTDMGADVLLISHDPKINVRLDDYQLPVGTWGFRTGHQLEETDGYLDPQSFKVMQQMGWPKEVVDYFEFIYQILQRTKEQST